MSPDVPNAADQRRASGTVANRRCEAPAGSHSV